ncbi:transcription elongation factor GreA, partial [Vibrio parahaemolyticus]
MEKVPMTLRGEQMLRTELERLLKLRPQISEA